MIKKLFMGTLGLALNVVFYIVIFLLAVRLVTYSYDFSYNVFGEVVMDEEAEETTLVQIPDGASTEEIAALLEKKGLIKYKNAFIIHVALSEYKGMLQSGDYELSPAMTMDEMLEIISGASET